MKKCHFTLALKFKLSLLYKSSYMSNMETFTSAAMNVYLDGLAPTSKIAYVNKMTSFIEFCEEGKEDGPYNLSLEDVSTYLVHLHESGYKESMLWSSLSILATFSRSDKTKMLIL